MRRADGIVLQGSPIRYVDAGGEERSAFMESLDVKHGDAADIKIAVVRSGLVVLDPVLAVPHSSEAGGPPYWLEA